MMATSLATCVAVATLLGCATAVDTPAVPPVVPPVVPAAWTLVGTEPWFYVDNPGTRIYTSNIDGTNKKYLTGNDGSRVPAWSCDGKKIIYELNNQVWMMNADGTGKKQLTFAKQPAKAPSIACNGKIAFTSNSPRTANPTIWIMDSSTSAPRQISDDNYFDVSPQISPDGTKVSFTRYHNWSWPTHKDTGRDVFVVNVDGTNSKQLTYPTDPNAPNSNAASWSPDSKKLVFFNGFEEEGQNRTKPDIRHLTVINADGTGRYRPISCDAKSLAGGDGTPGSCADDPNWSPDGRSIIYSGAGMKTWIIAADGSTPPKVFLNDLFTFGYGGGRPWK